MQIVSKGHNFRSSGTTRPVRVEAVAGVSTTHDERKDRKSRGEKTQSFPDGSANGFDLHSIIAAQVIASRMMDVVDLSAANSDLIAGDNAYASALARKVHHMDAGSFYNDAA